MNYSRAERKERFESAQERAAKEFPYVESSIRHIPHDAKLDSHIEWTDKESESMLSVECQVTRNDCLVDAKLCIDSITIPSSQPGATAATAATAATTATRVLVINSASLGHQGGGAKNGANAQEESLCRRTNLFSALGMASNMKKGGITYSYPLHYKVKGIFTGNITVFRDENEEDCVPYQVDVLSVFSRHHKAIEKERLSIEEIYHDIFQAIMMTIQKRNSTHVVFVPVGCGAFRNDPEFVASMFVDYLRTCKKPACLQKIIVSCYGIYGDTHLDGHEEEDSNQGTSQQHRNVKTHVKKKKDSYTSFSWHLNCNDE